MQTLDGLLKQWLDRSKWTSSLKVKREYVINLSQFKLIKDIAREEGLNIYSDELEVNGLKVTFSRKLKNGCRTVNFK